MAQRRMFSLKIVDSARFIKMPPSTQLLYFHMGLRADDDGIVEGYNVMRMVGATEDDLKLLVAKGFVTVLNEDLVSYINDWKEHNLIRADRKVDSIYKDLLLRVVPEIELVAPRERADRRKVVQLLQDGTSHGQPEDNQCQAMDGLGKDRLGKDRIGEDSIGQEKKKGIDCLAIVNAYKETCVSLPSVKTLSDARKKAIKARFNSGYTQDDFITLFQKAQESDFLKGKNDRNWAATFDWLIKDANMAKVLDGNYDNKGGNRYGRDAKNVGDNSQGDTGKARYSFPEL